MVAAIRRIETPEVVIRNKRVMISKMVATIETPDTHDCQNDQKSSDHRKGCNN